jgi:hypothetical protein
MRNGKAPFSARSRHARPRSPPFRIGSKGTPRPHIRRSRCMTRVSGAGSVRWEVWSSCFFGSVQLLRTRCHELGRSRRYVRRNGSGDGPDIGPSSPGPCGPSSPGGWLPDRATRARAARMARPGFVARLRLADGSRIGPQGPVLHGCCVRHRPGFVARLRLADGSRIGPQGPVLHGWGVGHWQGCVARPGSSGLCGTSGVDRVVSAGPLWDGFDRVSPLPADLLALSALGTGNLRKNAR